MKHLETLFDGAAPGPQLGNLTEKELLDREFTASDPESLEGVSDEIPEDLVPEVEFFYRMTGRSEMVRCVYCKFPNHYHGIVVRYPNGVRNLVGRDCALTHHGVAFEKKLVEFDAAVERQSYVRRKHFLLTMSSRVLREFARLLSHPAVTEHDKLLARWRREMPDIAAGIANLAKRGERLTFDSEVRDVAGEKERRARLGDRFEEERQAAKAAGERWQLFKPEKVDLGPLDGASFFEVGQPADTRLRDIQAKMQQTFNVLSGDGLRTTQIRAGLRKLADLRDALSDEYGRLEAVVTAFSPENLARIAKWANDQAADQVRREAVLLNEKCPPIYDRYVADGSGITEYKRGRKIDVSPPSAYHAPERTLIAILKEATSVENELLAAGLSSIDSSAAASDSTSYKQAGLAG